MAGVRRDAPLIHSAVSASQSTKARRRAVRCRVGGDRTVKPSRGGVRVDFTADFIDLSIMSCTETNKLDRITADGMSVRREVLKERALLATG